MPRKKQLKMQRLNFWVTEKMHQHVVDLAFWKGWTTTEAVRHLISAGLEVAGKNEGKALREELDELKRRVDSLSNTQEEPRHE